jgi:hypothetical protein
MRYSNLLGWQNGQCTQKDSKDQPKANGTGVPYLLRQKKIFQGVWFRGRLIA